MYETDIYKEFPISLVKLEYFKAKVKGMDIRTTLAPWYYYRNCAGKILDTVKLKFSEAYKNYKVGPLNAGAQNYTKEGYMYQTADPAADKGNPNIILWDKEKVLEVEKKYFKKLVQFCREKKMELVVITTPVPAETLEMHKRVFEKAHEYYVKLMEKYKVPYYDFNFMEMDGFDKGLEGYLDYEGHMSGEVGDEFSRELGEKLLKMVYPYGRQYKSTYSSRSKNCIQ